MEQNDLLLISDYLAGDLPDSERAAVTQRMIDDPKFAALVQMRQAEADAFRAIARAEAKTALRAQFDRNRQRQNPAPRRLWTVGLMAMAAAAAVALLVLVWLAPWQAAPAPRALALASLEPFPMTVERGAAKSDQPQWEASIAAYQAGDYAAARDLLRSLHEAAPDDPRITLYLAECLSQTGNYADATTLLQPLAAQSPFQDAAQWRLALNYLLAGQDALAIPLLENIRKGPHYRQAQAGGLLEGMGAE